MKATAIKQFTATMSGRVFRCKEGDALEADAKTIGQLEAIGLVTTKSVRKPKTTRKAADND